MKPTLPVVIVLEVEEQEQYHVGDIIVFNAIFWIKFCHRIVSIDEKRFTTKGDNRKKSNLLEKNVPIRKIVGKVIL